MCVPFSQSFFGSNNTDCLKFCLIRNENLKIDRYGSARGLETMFCGGEKQGWLSFVEYVPIAFCSLLEECVDDKKTLRKVETLHRENSFTIVWFLFSMIHDENFRAILLICRSRITLPVTFVQYSITFERCRATGNYLNSLKTELLSRHVFIDGPMIDHVNLCRWIVQIAIQIRLVQPVLKLIKRNTAIKTPISFSEVRLPKLVQMTRTECVESLTVQIFLQVQYSSNTKRAYPSYWGDLFLSSPSAPVRITATVPTFELTMYENDTIALACYIAGDPTPSVSWMKVGGKWHWLTTNCWATMSQVLSWLQWPWSC